MLHLAEQLAELCQFPLEQEARVRREQLRDADGRCVRAMNGAERVLDEEVVRVRELARERWIVLRLAGIEPSVLEHLEAIVAHCAGQRFAYRLDRERRIRALWPAEVRADRHHPGVVLEQPLKRRQCGAD